MAALAFGSSSSRVSSLQEKHMVNTIIERETCHEREEHLKVALHSKAPIREAFDGARHRFYTIFEELKHYKASKSNPKKA